VLTGGIKLSIYKVVYKLPICLLIVDLLVLYLFKCVNFL